jgi:hypothetical protein
MWLILNDSLVLLITDPDDIQYNPESQEKFILQGDDRWKLFIVEDADEFLQADAKDRTGQALSRLLNLADGLIGQGLNYIILITTNELMVNIHKAVSREGRCLADIEFQPFSKSEAVDWFGDDLVSLPVSETFTLAKLFDLRRDRQQLKVKAEEVVTGVYL